MLKKVIGGLAVLIFVLAGILYGEEKSSEKKVVKIDFEVKSIPSDWEVEGKEVKIATDNKHSGENSLFLGDKSSVIIKLTDKDKLGKVTMWVYDSGLRVPEGKTATGPRWGLMNAFTDKFVIANFWASYLNGNAGYAWICTGENAWYDRWWTGISRSMNQWNKWTFTFEEDLKIMINDNDKKVLTIAKDKLKNMAFDTGFVGLYFYGGQDTTVGIYIDDIEVEFK